MADFPMNQSKECAIPSRHAPVPQERGQGSRVLLVAEDFVGTGLAALLQWSQREDTHQRPQTSVDVGQVDIRLVIGIAILEYWRSLSRDLLQAKLNVSILVHPRKSRVHCEDETLRIVQDD